MGNTPSAPYLMVLTLASTLARRPTRSVSRSLLVLIVALVARPARAQDETMSADTFLLEGIVQEPAPRDGALAFFQFEVRRSDSVVVVTPLSAADFKVGPLTDMSRLPESSGDAVPLQIPAPTLLMIAEQVEGSLAKSRPSSRFGVSVDGGRIHLTFVRGIPLVTLLLAGLLIVLVSVAGTAYGFTRRDRRRAAVAQLLSARQIEASEAERTRIAREIHDGPLQDLHAVRAQATAHATRASDTELVGPFVEGIGSVARELRAIAEGLRPPALGRFGLAAALASHGDRFLERHPHVDLRVSADEAAPALTPSAEASLFRVAQEALVNAVRHGHARSVVLEYAAEPLGGPPERVRLEIRDDGVGLPAGFDAEDLVARGHFGIAGMRERAALMGGRLEVSPAPFRAASSGGADDSGTDARRGLGTTVRLTVPLSAVALSSRASLL